MDNYKKAAQAVFIFFALFYSFFSIGHFGGDGYGDYLTAESIILDGNLSLYDRPSDADDLNYLKGLGTVGRDGKTYSSRPGLGIALILSLFYLLGHTLSLFLKAVPHDFITMFFVSFANPLLSALNCLFIFIIAKHLKFSLRCAAVITLIYGLSTMAPVYARTGFSDPALVLFMLIAIYFLLKYRDLARTKYIAYSALALAYGVFVKPAAVIFLPAYAAYVASLAIGQKETARLAERVRGLGIFIVFSALSLLLIGWYNYHIYGSFLKFGGREAAYIGKRIMDSTHFLKGIYYYLFSTGKGFFIFNLPIILGFFVLSRIPRERRREVVLFILIFTINLLFYAKSFRRGSLFSWGPRYLLPSVAALIFLLGDFYEAYKGIAARLALLVSSLAGFLIILPCMFVNQSKFYFFVTRELKLDEYMINFIPDLSPIAGAWRMFASNLASGFLHASAQFVYNPDYRLVAPIEAAMNKYNNFDFWFLKIVYYAPQYRNIVFVISALALFFAGLNLLAILKNTKRR